MLSSWRRPVPRRDARSGWGNGGGGADASSCVDGQVPSPGTRGLAIVPETGCTIGWLGPAYDPGAWDAPGVVARWSTLATVRTLAFPPVSRDVTLPII